MKPPAAQSRVLLAAVALGALAWGLSLTSLSAQTEMHKLPEPVMDIPAARPGESTAVFAGGCFWGVQGVFEHVNGVTRAVSGYAGGHLTNPGYEQVSTGMTGHAESVRVTFDPSKISYGQLLRIFFSVALDPTQVDRQGPDVGTQYRSALFVTDPEQDRVARAYVAQLEKAHVFSRPIATRIEPAGPFYPAEAYHQDYLEHHPDASYIAINDMPKVRGLQTLFPDSWRGKPALTSTMAAGN